MDKNRTGRAWDSGSSTKGKDLGVPKYGSNVCKPQKGGSSGNLNSGVGICDFKG